MSATEFGFTDNQKDFERVVAFRDAAIADGWSIRPTYGESEDIHRAASLERDGFTMQVISRVRKPEERWRFEGKVSMWGPDGLAIKPPEVYDWSAIRSAVRKCNLCGKQDVDTERYSFAGRCCKECLPEARKKHEYRGWTD